MPPASPPERATAAIARLGTTCDDPKTSAPYVLITCSKRGTVAGVSFTQTMPAASALPKSGTRFGAKTDHAPTMNSFVAVVDSGRVWLEEPCMICRINSTGYRIITLADASDEDLVAMAVEVGLPKKALHTEAEWLKALATVGTKE